jgi:phosphoribosylanthranilate isomerase
MVKSAESQTGDALRRRVCPGARFFFYKKSPRFLKRRRLKIIGDLPPFITPVGIFVDQPLLFVISSNIAVGRSSCTASRLRHRLRRYGAKIIKVFRWEVLMFPSRTGDAFLFDTLSPEAPGGTGKRSIDLLKDIKGQHKPFILSGGLNRTLIEPVNAMKPYAVDVASGVESAREKTHRLLKEFTSHHASGPNVKSHVE